MELNIEIETYDKMLSSDLFETTKFSAGQTKRIIAEGISIRYEGGMIRKAVDFPEIINIALTIGEHVVLPIAVGILSRYLYDKLKDRKASKVTINHTQVEINADKIETLILEILKREEKE